MNDDHINIVFNESSIDEIDKYDGEVWICNNCGKYVTESVRYCPCCTNRLGKTIEDIDTTDIEIFWDHYTKWCNETQFLSSNIYDNDHFKAISDPMVVPMWETLRGVHRILEIKDDFVVNALSNASKKILGHSPITTDGYTELHEYCNAWRWFLDKLMECDDEDTILDGIEDF